jgi:beta-1,4-mannosyl-glycoprotein beta-1,4-N-acetylglucosaminyltransferase
MIVDCFAFFDELDVLEIRLRELSEVVERFVLVESPITFSGRQKPLWFHENQDRFKPWRDQIEHHVWMDGPCRSSSNRCGCNAWSRDWAQKQFAMEKGLEGLSNEDVLSLSDCDEIPRALELQRFAADPQKGLAIPLMPIFYFWLNCRQVGPFEKCAKWVTRGKLRELKDDFRTLRELRSGDEMPNGGWHFSYMSDVSRKIKSWAHTEYDVPETRSADHLLRCKLEGTDPFGRDFEYEFLGDLSYLPECVKADLSRWSRLIRK